MRYFLSIMDIQGFCYFVIFLSHYSIFDTPILDFVFSRIVERLSLIHGCKHNWSNHIKTLVRLYVNFFIFVFLNSYSNASKIS